MMRKVYMVYGLMVLGLFATSEYQGWSMMPVMSVSSGIASTTLNRSATRILCSGLVVASARAVTI